MQEQISTQEHFFFIQWTVDLPRDRIFLPSKCPYRVLEKHIKTILIAIKIALHE
jgi:hypothetical protein